MGLCAQAPGAGAGRGVFTQRGRRGRKLRKEAQPGDLEELGASPRRAEAAWGGAATVTQSSGGRVQRARATGQSGAPAGPGEEGGRAGRAPGRGGARSGPPTPPPPPPPGPAHNTSHVCSDPSLGAGSGRAGGGERCPEGEGSVGRAGEWAPGPGKAAAGGCLEGDGGRAAGRRGAGPVARGGACCWGWRRKRGGEAGLRLPVRAACLLPAGEL